ncbi:hypothetical protein [Parasphingorhabdus sp.]|uniref:hypothetical protein n=1 Tax=Parasphingorhabdus sp. TaxID=2709688 RepID=UPI003A93FE9D
MIEFTMARGLKSAVAAGALLGLGGCMYGSAGYYGDGYVNGGYDCDPYAPFDDYYACDYGYGFANIGFGGGWYDHYYYPGYGVYIFDRGGRRHAMRDNHRRHWARQRAEYGGHHVRGRNLTPQQRANRRDRRDDRRDDARDQRRGNYRDNIGTRNGRGDRARTGARSPQQNGQAAPVRNRGDRAGTASRRPSRAVERPQTRTPPVARPATTSRPVRTDPPRPSARNGRNGRKHVNDD